jgi:transcriptional regulator with XRE-family HTH domain
MRNTDDTGDLRRFLRAERKRRGWTQADLGRVAGVSKNTVASLENGMALREGNEGAIEEALGLPLGTMDRIRQNGLPADPAQADRQETPVPEPRPGDYPDQMEYMNAVYWYLRRGLGLSQEAVTRGFDMAAAVYAKRNSNAERIQPSTNGEEMG